MPFHIEDRYFPAETSNNCINTIARSDTPPEVGLWEKIKVFFCSASKPEAQALIRQICHPPDGTEWETVTEKFEQLKTLAHDGFKERIQVGRDGENHACILDENGDEMLSVTVDKETGNYTVRCQEGGETHHLTTTAAPQTTQDYEAIWSAWENAAPAGEAPGRADAIQRMRDCLHNDGTELNLSNLELTSLPDYLPAGLQELRCDGNQLTVLPALPAGLQKLTCSETPLTCLPSELPAGLQKLSCNYNQLTSLPPLPTGLQKLGCYHNQLTRLPPLPTGLQELSCNHNQLTSLLPLPTGLQELNCYHNQLTSLPPLPTGLQELSCNDNQLTSLPTLPAGLQTLRCNHNQLTRLPALPAGLQNLFCCDNQLTSLPALPTGLLRLYAVNNQLTTLPESIAGLFRAILVAVSGNPLSAHSETITRDLAYSPASRKPRPLHLAVAGWLTPAQEKSDEPVPADRWQSFRQEDNADAFSTFLDRLKKTENFRKDPGFKAQIASWLTQLAEDDALRVKTFAMATGATSSCEDRVTLALNQMKNVVRIHDAEKGKYDNNLSELVSAGREMFRLEKLELIARNKVRTLREVDEIEVYLGYQNKLKEQLELSSVTAEMRFFEVSYITESDLRDAGIRVKIAENLRFREWILQWAPLHSVLKRTNPEHWEKCCEKKISDYSDTFRMLSDTALKPNGLAGDNDAERAAGVRALESAERAFLDELRPLVNNMPGNYPGNKWFL
ncbi:NEL-type E3 ubiquitin ligase domain-containing protein [Morganella morganii]|uniref:NEL-type E3 ubiquitin ligase domain-containing protein n=1 Tax=Morganella morganii TaxID=582 RepID=UPI00339BB1AA